MRRVQDSRSFQSTCPRGARLGRTSDSGVYVFQSTCPRGARQKYFYSKIKYYNFNPRAHEGHDFTFSIPRSAKKISIHVPTRGTTIDKINNRHQNLFQSTCPRGARLPVMPVNTAWNISIHVPTRGTTARADWNPARP